MLRLLLVTDGVFPNSVGGMQRHSRHLAEELARCGVAVTVVHPHEERVFADQRIHEVTIPFGGRRGPGHYIRDLSDYAAKVDRFIGERSGEFDIVYGQGATLMSYLESDSRLPTIVNPHGLEMLQPFGISERVISTMFRRVLRRSVRGADRVVSLGGKLTDLLVRFGVPVDRIVERPNAIDLAQIDAKRRHHERDGRSLVFVGRLAGNKGLPELIAAARSLREKAQFIVVGDGPLRPMVERAHADGLLDYRGKLSDGDLFDLLSRAEALVLPTRGEGMPTVVLEAMACETPVIVSDVGAVRVMVTAETGFVIEPGSTPALADAALRLLSESAEHRRRMGRTGRARIERHFAWPVVARQTVNDLMDILAGSPRKRAGAQ